MRSLPVLALLLSFASTVAAACQRLPLITGATDTLLIDSPTAASSLVAFHSGVLASSTSVGGISDNVFLGDLLLLHEPRGEHAGRFAVVEATSGIETGDVVAFDGPVNWGVGTDVGVYAVRPHREIIVDAVVTCDVGIGDGVVGGLLVLLASERIVVTENGEIRCASVGLAGGAPQVAQQVDAGRGIGIGTPLDVDAALLISSSGDWHSGGGGGMAFGAGDWGLSGGGGAGPGGAGDDSLSAVIRNAGGTVFIDQVGKQGKGGLAYPATATADVTLLHGSGGGAGPHDDDVNSLSGVDGGNGGGIVLLGAPTVDLQGTIDVRGGDGVFCETCHLGNAENGASGGGGGGDVRIIADAFLGDTSGILLSGGLGADPGTIGPYIMVPSGAGGDGRVAVLTLSQPDFYRVTTPVTLSQLILLSGARLTTIDPAAPCESGQLGYNGGDLFFCAATWLALLSSPLP